MLVRLGDKSSGLVLLPQSRGIADGAAVAAQDAARAVNPATVALRRNIENALARATQGDIGPDGNRSYNPAPLAVLNEWKRKTAWETQPHAITGTAFDLAYKNEQVDPDDLLALESLFPAAYRLDEVLASPWLESGRPVIWPSLRTKDTLPEWSVRRFYRGVASFLPIYDENRSETERKQLRALGARLIARGEREDPNHAPASFRATLFPLAKSVADELAATQIPGAIETANLIYGNLGWSQKQVATQPSTAFQAVANVVTPSKWPWWVFVGGGLLIAGAIAVNSAAGSAARAAVEGRSRRSSRD